MNAYVKQGLRAITRTDDDPILLVLRVALGLMIVPHGAQKVLGWFGGGGFGGTIEFFQAALGLPAVIAVAVAVLEFYGGIALLAGLFGRLAAASIAVIMVGAVATSHAQFGFFMNWSGAQGGEGWEFHLLAVAIALAVVVRGSGPASLDRLIQRRLGGIQGVKRGEPRRLRAEDVESGRRVATMGQR